MLLCFTDETKARTELENLSLYNQVSLLNIRSAFRVFKTRRFPSKSLGLIMTLDVCISFGKKRSYVCWMEMKSSAALFPSMDNKSLMVLFFVFAIKDILYFLLLNHRINTMHYFQTCVWVHRAGALLLLLGNRS